MLKKPGTSSIPHFISIRGPGNRKFSLYLRFELRLLSSRVCEMALHQFKSEDTQVETQSNNIKLEPILYESSRVFKVWKDHAYYFR